MTPNVGGPPGLVAQSLLDREQRALIASDGHDGYDTRAAGPDPFSRDALATDIVGFLPAPLQAGDCHIPISPAFFVLSGARGWLRAGAGTLTR